MHSSYIALAMLLVGCAVEPPAPPVITLEEFNKIESGMTLAQVEEIVGAEGTEMSRVEIPGAPLTVMYQWSNPDFSNATVQFQGADQESMTMIVKAQAQLK